jgi:hypothetical protein
MSTAIERLTEQLDQKDAELEDLQGKLDEAEREVESVRDGWMRHRKQEIDDETLPLPRMEIDWRERDGWRDFEIEFRLVVKHLLGYLVLIPLGLTRSQSSSEEDPRRHGLANALPFRDGAHAPHDAALLGLPLFAIMPEGPVLVDCRPHATASGLAHRRPLDPEKPSPTDAGSSTP